MSVAAGRLGVESEGCLPEVVHIIIASNGLNVIPDDRTQVVVAQVDVLKMHHPEKQQIHH